MNTTSMPVRTKKGNDLVLRSARIIFGVCLSMLLMVLAFFGGLALGNGDIVDTALENEASETLETAQAGTSSGGTNTVSFYVSNLGRTSVTTNFSASNVHYSRYWEGNDHGNETYFGAGIFGNGGTTLRQKKLVSTASTNFQFSGVAGVLQQKGLLQITIEATVKARNKWDGPRAYGYKLGSSAMTVAINSTLLSGCVKIAEKNTTGNNETFSGSKTLTLKSTETTVCLAVAGYCNYTGWVGGRYPGQQLQDIAITCTSLDSTKPTITLPTISSWVADKRPVSFSVSDNAQVSSVVTKSNGTAFTPSITTTTATWTVSFEAAAANSYTLEARDSTGNLTTSSSYNYTDFKIDAYSPKVLRVLFVEKGNITKLVSDGKSPASGNPSRGPALCYIEVEDYQSTSNYSSGTIYASGIQTVKFNGVACTQVAAGVQLPNGITTSVVNTVDGKVGKAWYVCGTDLTANFSDMKVEVLDYVGKTSGPVSVAMYYLDNVAPVVESAVVTFGSTTLTTSNASQWFNTTGMLTLTIFDAATTATISNTRSASGLSNITIKGTQFSRNGTTSGGATTAINASFNPTSATATSGTNGTGGPAYMTRTSYVSATSGSNYGYRYIITVPIFYRSDYSFIITDKAGNSTTQFKYNHTSGSVATYKPQIDQTAPTFSSVTVSGYVAAGQLASGNPKTDYVNAKYLEFKVSANDMDANGRNDGSGITKIQIYTAGGTLVSEWTGTAYQSSTTPKSLFVYDTTYQGTLDTTYKAKVDINSCTTASYNIVITDAAGNATTMTPSTATYSMELNPNGTTVINQPVFVDNIAPSVTVKSGNTALQPSTATYSGDTNTRIYEYDWTATSQSISLAVAFGCSGATVYRYYNGLSDDKRTNLKIYTGASYNRNNNSQTINETYSNEGISYYSFKIINGAGVAVTGKGTAADTSGANYLNIVLKIKIDKTAPSYELLGFGTSITVADKNDKDGVKNSIVSPLGSTKITENLLTQANAYYDNEFYAYYYIKDTFGTTVDNPDNTSWLSGGQAGAQVTVKHGNYSYTFSAPYEAFVLKSGTKFTLLRVRMYDLTTLQKMTYNSVSIYNSSTQTYNLTYGQNVVYNINIKDKVGNTGSIKGGDDCVALRGKTDLSYNVDPFPINRSQVLVPKDIYNLDYYGLYDYPQAGATGWTSVDVKYTISKQTSITPVICEYRLIPMTDANDTHTPTPLVTEQEREDIAWISVGDLGSATSATFTLSALEGSKCAFIEFRIRKSYAFGAEANKSNREYNIKNFTAGGKTYDYVIKQDVDAPIITAIFFSRNSNLAIVSEAQALADSRILAYFKANLNDNVYTFTRLTSNIEVWTYETFYMYVIATDSRGAGAGAGVKTVTLTNQAGVSSNAILIGNANTSGENKYTGEQLFVSAVANFGYDSTTNNNPIKFLLADKTPTSNKTSEISANLDTAGGRILPRVDTKAISISLTGATYGSGSGYIANGKLKGDSIRETLNITISYQYGISGAKIYRAEYPAYYGKNYNDPSFDPWSFPANFTGTTVQGSAPTVLAGLFDNSNLTGLKLIRTINPGSQGSGTYTDTISNSVETKARYYYFIVSNVNEYAGKSPIGYLVAGDVFIDNTPPTINSSVFVSEASGNAMDINTVYTNDSVSAYLYVSDGASGIYNVYLKSGSLANSLEAYRTGGTALQYIDSGARAGSYKYTMTGNTNYQFIVFDNAGNYVVSSEIKPKIDNVVPDIKIDTKRSDGSSYNSKNANNFTNSPYISVTIEVTLGLSGLNSLMYRVNGGAYQNISTLRDKNGNPVVLSDFGAYSKKATFDIAANGMYEFRATNNIAASYAKNGTVPTANGTMYIAIDVTKPTLNESNAQYESTKVTWHSTPRALILDAADNVGGSGIDEIHVFYTSARDGLKYDEFFKFNSASGKFERYTRSGSTITFLGDFFLDEFITYSIEITDVAGNKSVTYTIRPALDVTSPGFTAAYTMATADGNYVGGSTGSPNWTKNNVNIILTPKFTMSGATVQVSTRENAAGAQWSGWTTIRTLTWDKSPISAIPNSDAGKFLSIGHDFVYTVKPAEGKKSVNSYYRFRIVSNAGVEYVEPKEVLIQIDQEIPEFAPTTNVSDINANGFARIQLAGFNSAGDAYTYTFGNSVWSSKGVSIESVLKSTPASGYTLQYAVYNVNENRWNDWTVSTVNPFTHTADTPGVNYKFRYISGSQIPSKELIVMAIKVDKQLPKVTLTARTSFTGITSTDGSFATADKNSFVNGGIYNTQWTNAKYVVLSVTATFGYSGTDLYFEADGTLIDKNTIGIAYGESGELYYFIPYTVSLRVTAVSRSGLTGYATREICIDNLLPELYVSEITGTKSTNWDNTPENSWFTGSTYFKFGVGTYKNKTGTPERNLDLSGNPIPSPSGFVIEYRTRNANGTYTEWAAISGTTNHDILSMEVIEGRVYRFRIRSNSGMINELGQDIVYNGQVMATAAAVENNIKQYHPDALISHLSANKFDYLINMDKNTYYITTTQNIKFFDGAGVQDSFSTNYAQYIYKIYVNGQWVLTSEYRPGKDYEYKHGDLVQVTYQSNYDDGKYLHRYTDYSEYFETTVNGVATRNVVSTRTFASANAQDELSGSIQFRFTSYNYLVESYFKQEVTAAYSNKVAYVQAYRGINNPTFASNIDLKYYYKVGDSTYAADLGVTLTYTNLTTGQLQAGAISVAGKNAIGGYLITATLDNEINRQSFVITNPNDILLVKYFTVNGNNPYTVNDTNDFEVISSSYYDGYNPATLTLNPAVTYLSGDFRQAADITLPSDFTAIGMFTGTYDGNGKTITFAHTIIADGAFGLFTSVKGNAGDYAAISNLAIVVPNIVVRNATNVGILAGYMEYAKVNNVRINAQMIIDSAVYGATIGGLAGSAVNSEIGGISANYVDVRMSHNGFVSGNAIAHDVSIGGVIGRAGVNTYYFNTYCFGGMEIYGTGTVYAGAAIGTLDQYVTAANKDNFFGNNVYLSGNVFVNDALAADFIGRDLSAVKVVTASGLNYSDFVAITAEVVGRTVRDSVLMKLYADFGMAVTHNGTNYVYANGIGTADDMLEISTVAHIETINEYVMLFYKLTADVDMTDFDRSIAIHKIFGGVLEGKDTADAILRNFSGGISEGYYGLFANLNGTVRNIVFEDLKVNIDYEGSDDLYIGLIAGKAYENADINNIIAIGSIRINAPHSDVMAGGFVGETYYGAIYNVFNMANIKVTARETSLGGIIGASANTILVNGNGVSDAIFSLARVEGVHSGFGNVGAIVGSGSLLEAKSDMSKVFALNDNTYSNGSIVNRTVGSSSVNSGVLTTFGNTVMRSTSVSDGNLFVEVFVTRDLYPLKGVSSTPSSTVGADADNPFMITDEEDFKYINNALYANYRIVAPDNKITFSSFETIGEGLFFTGKIDGKTAASGSAEEGEVVSLDGVTDALVWYNKGTISDLSVNVNYTRNLGRNENAEFGAIAKYNKGAIRNVIVSGDIVINGGNSVTASGFVGVDYGGVIDNSSIKNSISSIDITVNGAGSVFIGGYIGKVIGTTTVNFAIGQGNIFLIDCPSYYAGWLIGSIEGNLEIELSLIKDYAYTINIVTDGVSETIISDLTNYTGLKKTV
ncbi:MAG TPA: hypothetical protein PKY53_03675 [Clostridia bacterium]|nr:hypothetical protein [Clostridia bacterium]